MDHIEASRRREFLDEPGVTNRRFRHALQNRLREFSMTDCLRLLFRYATDTTGERARERPRSSARAADNAVMCGRESGVWRKSNRAMRSPATV